MSPLCHLRGRYTLKVRKKNNPVIPLPLASPKNCARRGPQVLSVESAAMRSPAASLCFAIPAVTGTRRMLCHFVLQDVHLTQGNVRMGSSGVSKQHPQLRNHAKKRKSLNSVPIRAMCLYASSLQSLFSSVSMKHTFISLSKNDLRKKKIKRDVVLTL